MTLPPCIRTHVEASVIFALAHKLAKVNVLNEDGGASDLLDVYPPVASAAVDISMANKRPFTEAPPEEGPAKKVRIRMPRPSCSLPTSNDPMERSFYMKLYTSEDEGKINPVHNFIRRSVLDVRRTVSGKIFLQCTCCKHLPRCERAKCSTLAPQSIGSLYRAMIRFMMYHVPVCEHIPQDIKGGATSDQKVVRGTKNYWRESAEKIGLRDGEDGMNIVYCRPTE